MRKIYELLLLVVFTSVFSTLFAQTDYVVCGPNKITNSDFNGPGSGSTNIPNWTLTPPNDDEG